MRGTAGCVWGPSSARWRWAQGRVTRGTYCVTKNARRPGAEANNQGVSVNSAKKCAEMPVYVRNRGACGARRRRDGDGRKAGRLAGFIVSRKTLVARGPRRTIKACASTARKSVPKCPNMRGTAGRVGLVVGAMEMGAGPGDSRDLLCHEKRPSPGEMGQQVRRRPRSRRPGLHRREMSARVYW
jgi:hypothetical protein